MLYKSSKGDRVIAEMPLPYAANALAKLIRSEPTRQAEIDALQAHVDKLTAAAANDDNENPRVVIGGNNPPEPTPAVKVEGRTAVEAHVADLLTEATNWADGVALVDQSQADAVGRLHRMLQEAAALVDDTATKEKKPHNDAITEIAAWQNGFTAKGLKKTPDGKLTNAVVATGRLSAGWLTKLDEERRAREKVAADAALAAAAEAIALREEAKVSTDLSVMDRAEDAITAAKSLLREAEGVSKERVRSGGGDGFRAVGLRSIYAAHLNAEAGGWGAAYAHYKTNPQFMQEFHELIQRWADRDARSEATRARGVPGFTMVETKVAA